MRPHNRLFSAAVLLAFSPANPAAAGPIPSGVTSGITSNFNGTPIPGDSFIWFNSVIHLNGDVPTTPFTISSRDAWISFSAGSTNYTLSVPDADIRFNSTAKATTTFSNGRFVTETDPSFSGNTFLAGLALRVPATGFPGGIKPVTWTAAFYASDPGLDIHWKWAAADYASFSTDFNALGIKPTDASRASLFANSDHAGTPEAFKSFVVGGARGGGGSNATGSYSGTAGISSPTSPGVAPTPEPPSVLLAVLGLFSSALLLAGRRRARVDRV